VEFKLKDIAEGFDEESVDAIFLDVPEKRRGWSLFELEAELSREIGANIQITDLNQAHTPLLGYEIICDGELLIDKDEAVRLGFRAIPQPAGEHERARRDDLLVEGVDLGDGALRVLPREVELVLLGVPHGEQVLGHVGFLSSGAAGPARSSLVISSTFMALQWALQGRSERAMPYFARLQASAVSSMSLLVMP